MHILIVRNNSNSKAVDASLLLGTYLSSQGIGYTLADSSDLAGVVAKPEVRALLSGEGAYRTGMAVALGGDGTILRTARQVGYLGVPILGINFGTLGFLANPSDDGVVAIVAAALAGEVTEDRRANLSVRVVCEGEPDPWYDGDDELEASGFEAGQAVDGLEGEGSASPREFFALNEIAVTRGSNGRIIDFSLGVSGAPLAEMRGDGLVVATATGSTAYAMSAGGPLVSPGYTGLVAVPIAPHSLRSRAVVTSPSDVVEMDLSSSSASREAVLFVDGELLEFDRPPRHVYVRRGEAPTTLLRYGGPSFYEHVSKVFF